jgi:hypothetical protein
MKARSNHVVRLFLEFGHPAMQPFLARAGPASATAYSEIRAQS